MSKLITLAMGITVLGLVGCSDPITGIDEGVGQRPAQVDQEQPWGYKGPPADSTRRLAVDPER